MYLHLGEENGKHHQVQPPSQRWESTDGSSPRSIQDAVREGHVHVFPADAVTVARNDELAGWR